MKKPANVVHFTYEKTNNILTYNPAYCVFECVADPHSLSVVVYFSRLSEGVFGKDR